MTRQTFVTLSAAVAIAVAAFALILPGALLVGKGVQPNPTLLVWVREVGVLILAAGITVALVRKAPDSAALRGVLMGNAVLHLGMLPIELVAFSQGLLTKLGGVVPNSVLHLVLAFGFVVYARRVRVPRS